MTPRLQARDVVEARSRLFERRPLFLAPDCFCAETGAEGEEARRRVEALRLHLEEMPRRGAGVQRSCADGGG